MSFSKSYSSQTGLLSGKLHVDASVEMQNEK